MGTNAIGIVLILLGIFIIVLALRGNQGKLFPSLFGLPPTY